MVARRRQFQARGPRRKRSWARATGALTGITNAAPQQTDLLSTYKAVAGLNAVNGLTVARIRGNLDWGRSAGAGVRPSVTLGIKVDGFAVEAVDMAPVDFLAGGAHQDWMYWETGFSYPGLTTGRMSIDVKSMRKIDELGDTLWLVAECLNPADTYELSFGFSVLVLLP